MPSIHNQFTQNEPFAAFAYPELRGALRHALQYGPIALSDNGRVPPAFCRQMEKQAGFSPVGGWASLVELAEGQYFERVRQALVPTTAPDALPESEAEIRRCLLHNPMASLVPASTLQDVASLLGVLEADDDQRPPVLRSLISGAKADCLRMLLQELEALHSTRSYAIADLAGLLRTIVQLQRGPLEASLLQLSRPLRREVLSDDIPVCSADIWYAVALELLERWLVPCAAVTMVDDTRFAPFPALSAAPPEETPPVGALFSF